VTGHVLCRSDEVAEGSARGFVFGDGAERREFVLVRKWGVLRAYVNSCPHQLTPLETFPEKFLNEDGTLFVCSTHGARFRIEDGVCVSGPCEGKSLAALGVIEANGTVSVSLPS
jgi:nitrite reductase/ring-hydroxylating ferredoxin subunit